MISHGELQVRFCTPDEHEAGRCRPDAHSILGTVRSVSTTLLDVSRSTASTAADFEESFNRIRETMSLRLELDTADVEGLIETFRDAAIGTGRNAEAFASLRYPCPNHGDCTVIRIVASSDAAHRVLFYGCGISRLVPGDPNRLDPDPPSIDAGGGATIEELLDKGDALLAEVSAILHPEVEREPPDHPPAR